MAPPVGAGIRVPTFVISPCMRQKWAILLDSVDLVQAQNCQGDLTHAESRYGRDSSIPKITVALLSFLRNTL